MGPMFKADLRPWRPRGSVELRLDNTGALVVEVNPSLLCNQMTDNVELYIKLKLRIFSIILCLVKL